MTFLITAITSCHCLSWLPWMYIQGWTYIISPLNTLPVSQYALPPQHRLCLPYLTSQSVAIMFKCDRFWLTNLSNKTLYAWLPDIKINLTFLLIILTCSVCFWYSYNCWLRQSTFFSNFCCVFRNSLLSLTNCSCTKIKGFTDSR